VGTVAQASVDCTESTDTGYVSGDPFAITLVVADGSPVEINTANAYALMQTQAASDGVTITIVSGFRTWAEQDYLYGCYVNCNCNGCNLAAPPGYSNHESGHALDLNTADAGVLSWLNAHGSAFGFSRTVPSEDWHWEWWGGGPGGGPCSGGSGGSGGAPPGGCAPSPVAGAENEVFRDMLPGSLGHDEAILLEQAGITTGCSADPPLFCPGCDASRAQIVSFLIRAEGLPLVAPAVPTFSDVPLSSPYYATVETAAAQGITQGCGNGQFCPDAAVTRGQTAAFLRRTRGWPLGTPAQPSFSDVPASHPFFGDVEAILEHCVTTGCSATEYCPERPVTRAEAAVFVARAYDLGNINSCIGAGGAAGSGGSGGGPPNQGAGAPGGGGHAGHGEDFPPDGGPAGISDANAANGGCACRAAGRAEDGSPVALLVGLAVGATLARSRRVRRSLRALGRHNRANDR